MIRATLDANALASGLIGFEFSSSTTGAILRHWYEGRFELVVSPHMRSNRNAAALAPVAKADRLTHRKPPERG